MFQAMFRFCLKDGRCQMLEVSTVMFNQESAVFLFMGMFLGQAIWLAINFSPYFLVIQYAGDIRLYI